MATLKSILFIITLSPFIIIGFIYALASTGVKVGMQIYSNLTDIIIAE